LLGSELSGITIAIERVCGCALAKGRTAKVQLRLKLCEEEHAR